MPKKFKFEKSFTFDGQRYKIRADTEQELYEKMALKKQSLEEGRFLISGNMLVKDWIPQVLETYKPNISKKSRYDMEKRIDKYITSRIGNLRIRSVRPLQCQQILNSLSGMSKSQITKLHMELKFIFAKAKENHLIAENPAENLVRPEGYKHQRRSITDHERSHLLSVCEEDPRYIFFLLMLYCGCRPGEAAIIRRSDLIEKQGVWFLHIRGTKTINSDRMVPVVPELLPKLLEAGPFDLIAPNRAGSQHTESSYNRMVSSLKRDLNLSMGCRTYRNQLIPPYPLADDFVPYMLRHTFCTDLQKHGVDIRAAQKLMGHADIQTTANIYTHQDDDTLMQAAVLMGVPLGVPPKSHKNA